MAATRERYPGARPFTQDSIDRALFFGRDGDAEKVLHSILSEDLVVLFSRSGMGKTSLLQAGLFGRLRQRDVLPISVRVHTGPVQTGPGNIRGDQESLLSSVVRQIESAGREFEQGDAREYHHGDRSNLTKFFRSTAFWQDDRPITPLLVIDQFEELFTLHDVSSRTPFVAELANLLRQLKISQARQSGGRTKQRRLDVKILIVIREDYLGELEEIANNIPAIFRNRVRLTGLSYDDGEDAIREPALFVHKDVGSDTFEYTDDAVRQILDFLSSKKRRGEFVKLNEIAPYQLQVLCRSIDDKRRARRSWFRRAPSTIDASFLGGDAGMSKMLGEYYQRTLERLFRSGKAKQVQRLITRGLIDANGFRILRKESELIRRYGVTPADIVTLEREAILRAESRDGERYVELSHDRLLESIQNTYRWQRARNRRRLGMTAVAGLVLAGAALAIWSPSYFEQFKPKLTLASMPEDARQQFGGLVEYELALQASDPEDQIKLLQDAISPPHPHFAGSFHNLAQRYLLRGQPGEAGALLNQVNKEDPAALGVYTALGHLFKDKDNIPLAIACWRKACDDFPNQIDPNIRLLELLREAADTQGIEQHIEQLVKTATQPRVFQAVADELLDQSTSDQGLAQLATTCYSQALKLKPANEDEVLNKLEVGSIVAALTKIYVAESNLDALDVLIGIADEQAAPSSVFAQLAETVWQSEMPLERKTDVSLHAFRLAAIPPHKESLNQLVALNEKYLAAGEVGGVPSLVGAQCLLGNFERAIQLATEYEETLQGDQRVQAYRWRGWAEYMRDREPNPARLSITKTLTGGGGGANEVGEADLYNTLGLVLCAPHRSEPTRDLLTDAEAALTTALAKDRSLYKAYNNLALVHLRLARLSPEQAEIHRRHAKQNLEVAEKLRPGNSWLYVNKACYFVAQQRWPEALEALRKAKELGFADQEWLELERLLQEGGQNIEATGGLAAIADLIANWDEPADAVE